MNENAMGLIIHIASSNQGKIKEFKELLNHLPIRVFSQKKDFYVEETGNTFIDNARIKAKALADFTGEWALADDSGLCVDTLNGMPGVHSARYAKSDQERISKLLQELQFSSNRRARFHSALCISAPNKKIIVEAEADCIGEITKVPRGELGFGYDPIFQVLSAGLTFAEMSLEQKRKYGHRGKAFALLEKRLKVIINA